MTVSWINPGFLWALPLALAPLLLLWRRRPAPPAVVPFAATQLLEAVASQARRRQRRHQWWEIILRVAVLALLVLALARPVVERGAAGIARARDGGRRSSAPRPAVNESGATSAPLHNTPDSARPVRVVAEPREFLEAALGRAVDSGPGPGPSLVFLGDSFVGLGNVQTGETRVAAGPYYHPALQAFDAPGGDDLRDVRVHRWVKVEATGKTLVVARLANDDPFLLEALDDGVPRLVCTVAPEPGWSDLPLSPQFLPLVRELVRYLETGAGELPEAAASRPRGRDLSRQLLGLALVLALLELWPGGFRAWKLLPLAGLTLALVHPTFSWSRPRPKPLSPLVIVDRTGSMWFRKLALLQLLPALPAEPRVTISGDDTDLGEPLRREPSRPAVLVSDGQHNHGVSPAWVAARRPAPVWTVAVGDPGSPRDLRLTAARAAQRVFGDEPATVEAVLQAPGFDAPGYAVRIVGNRAGVLLQTNVSPGFVRLEFPVTQGGGYQLEVLPLAGEATPENNVYRWTLLRSPARIRVWLEHAGPTWEYRHARQALAGDPGVELVDDPSRAEVTFPATGDLWRLRRFGDAAFVRFWRSRVRAEWSRLHPDAVMRFASANPVELAALSRNDALLQEIARVSGGEFFTAATIDRLPAALAKAAVERRRFDLRDSLVALLVLVAGFTVCWAVTRASSETG